VSVGCYIYRYIAINWVWKYCSHSAGFPVRGRAEQELCVKQLQRIPSNPVPHN